MLEQHPFLDGTIEAETPIWRYFDFPKFVSLLEKSALYFSRADLLGDPLEGSFTKAYAADHRALLASPPDDVTAEELQDILRNNETFFAKMYEHEKEIRTIFISAPALNAKPMSEDRACLAQRSSRQPWTLYINLLLAE